MNKIKLICTILFSFLFVMISGYLQLSYSQTCTDADEDGFYLEGVSCGQVDCDDTDPNVYPGAPRICDAKDSDCDGFQDYFTDRDADGDGVPLCTHWQTGLRDCNDSNPNMYPSNIEAYGTPSCSDGIDNDCNYKVDIKDAKCLNQCIDSDGDGYGNPGHPSCPKGTAQDCNNNDANIHPGAADNICNGVDENCSGAADEGYVPTVTYCGVGECASTGMLSCSGGVETDSCTAGIPAKEGALGHPTCADTLDNDCDGATDGTDIGCQSSCLDDDGDGYGYYGDASCTSAGVDCDDDNAAINPGATDDVCDGVDANCSGTADDQYVPPTTNCGIGACATTGLLVCTAGVTADNCSPLTPGVEGPYGDPTCTDTADNDCDGDTDTQDFSCNPLNQDNDGDGFCEIGPCQNPANLGGDCDDTDSVSYPGAPRICDGKDNDCDGFQDFFTDKDGDGDGVPMCSSDCDDSNPNRFPGNIEAYGTPSCSDGIDNDCNYKIDIKDTKCLNQCNDSDGDGYGNPGHASCPNGAAKDCNNSNANIHPGATDNICDGVDSNCSGTADDGYVPTPTNCGVGECASTGILSCSGGVETDSCTAGIPAKEGALGHPTCSDTLDNDCDGLTDAPDPGCQSTCLDDDGDGFGYYGDVLCPNSGVDCDDANAGINPGAADAVCDGVDTNCSGTLDDQYVPTPTNCGIGECTTTGQLVCAGGVIENNCTPLEPGVEDYLTTGVCIDTLDNDCDGAIDLGDIGCNPLDVDNDGDGYCEGGPCQNPANLTGDCDDADATVHPGGSTTVCDGKDTNCDGFQDFFTDRDTDDDGVPLCGGDCNDSDPNRYPGNNEGPNGDATCSDAIDNDCDNKIDNADADCAPPTCGTKIGQKDGPHMFDLLDGGNNVLKTPCAWCHFDDSGTVDERTKCERCHADPADDGTLKILYPLDPPYGFGTAVNVQVHSSTVVDNDYGNWDMDCLTCHNPHLQEQDNIHGTSYGKYIKEYICFDNPVTGLNIEEVIEFTADSGEGSFADGPPQNENICEMCHTQTNHHRRTGDAPGDMDSGNNYIGHFDGEYCAGCHIHLEGFKPSCGGCHELPPFDVSTLVSIPGVTGSLTAGAHDQHVNVQGLDCDTCHYNSVGQGPTHNMDLTVTMGFSIFNDTYLGGSYDGQSAVSYNTSEINTTVSNTGTMTCSNIYCHSNVQNSTGTGGPSTYANPQWDDSSLACNACHGYPPASGAHQAHVNTTHHSRYEITCDSCHKNNIHAKGSIEINGDFVNFSYAKDGPPGNGFGFCAGACHIGAIWNSPEIYCFDCHLEPDKLIGYPAPAVQTAPVIIPEPDVNSIQDPSVTLEWNPVPSVTGPPSYTEYYVEVDDDPAFGSINYQSNWISETSWTVTVQTATTWHWRVRAWDAVRPNIQLASSWQTDSFIVTSPGSPPVPTLIPEPDYNSGGIDQNITLQWNEVTDPEGDPVEYYVQVSVWNNFSVIAFSSGWISGAEFTIPASCSGMYWRIRARDAISGALSPWSSIDYFQDVFVCGGSCPFLYVWDGDKFDFGTDLNGPGKLATKSSGGYFKPNPHDYYILDTAPVEKDGNYEMRLVEERFEVNYMDKLKLYTIDIPDNRDLYAEKPSFDTTFNGLRQELHTVDRNLANPVSIIHINTGEDVAAHTASSDGNFVILSNDRNIDFDYQTLEIDLGDLTQAPQIKLLIDGLSAFPTTPEGVERSKQFGPRTKIEVHDANGEWVAVSKATAVLPKPPEFRRPFVLDISDIFLSNVYKVRLTFLFKTYIDSIFVDTTADEAVIISEVPLLSAELRSYGHSEKLYFTDELYEYMYNMDNPNHEHNYFPGNYTRFGDVRSLLDAVDDFFVIYGSGDELSLGFNPVGSPPSGYTRKFLMYTNSYYKDGKVDVDSTVDPLPFAAMSNFPYDPAIEHYPDDQEHNQYLNDYNIRMQ